MLQKYRILILTKYQHQPSSSVFSYIWW